MTDKNTNIKTQMSLFIEFRIRWIEFKSAIWDEIKNLLNKTK